MRNIKDVVNREDWQTLRRTFIGTWKKTPTDNVLKLRTFLGVITSPTDEKLRIVHNYLTDSGFRIGMISHSQITELLNEVREARKNIFRTPLDFSKKVSYTYIKEDKNMTREEMIDLLLRNFLSMNYGKSIEQLTEGCRLERVRLSQMSDLKLQNMVFINC